MIKGESVEQNRPILVSCLQQLSRQSELNTDRLGNINTIFRWVQFARFLVNAEHNDIMGIFVAR